MGGTPAVGGGAKAHDARTAAIPTGPTGQREKDPSAPSLAASLLRLQRKAGNRAVTRAIASQAQSLQRLTDQEAARVAQGNEADVAQAINEHIYAHRYQDARRIAVRIGYMDTDDVAMIVVANWSGLGMQRAANDAAGRRLLLTLFHHLMTGSVDDDERRTAMRISDALAGSESAGEAQHNDRIMVFPWRNIGWTDVRQTVYEVEPRGDAQLWIRAPNSVLAYWHEEANLPGSAYTDGITIPANSRIRIVNHDNGRTENANATRLLELINGMNEQGRDMAVTAVVTGATAGLGGAGAAYGVAGEAAAAASGLVRAGTALAGFLAAFARIWGPLTTVVTEHEGTLVESYGEPARRFVGYVRQVNAIVGISQGVTALAQLPGKLRDVFNSGRDLLRVMRTGADAERDTVSATVAVGDAIRELNGSRGDIMGIAENLTDRDVWQSGTESGAGSPGQPAGAAPRASGGS